MKDSSRNTDHPYTKSIAPQVRGYDIDIQMCTSSDKETWMQKIELETCRPKVETCKTEMCTPAAQTETCTPATETDLCTSTCSNIHHETDSSDYTEEYVMDTMILKVKKT